MTPYLPRMHAPLSRPAIDRTGLLQGIGAYLIWGLLPLYFILLRGVGSGEVVASRILFSLLFLAAILALAQRGAKFRAAMRDRTVVAMLALSAALISINWLVYIWAVQHHQVVAGSMGYFLNPLVSVLLGVVVLKERLTRLQVVAVAIAAVGVAVLALSAADGLWISLTLALSFGLYGLVRKTVRVEALEGLAIETAILTPIALAYLGWLAQGPGIALGDDTQLTALLVASGVITAVPLLLFAASARRLPLATVGLLQYIAPTLQFLLAVLVLGESLTAAHILCFACIWSGIALYVTSTVRAPRRVRPA
ncbi:EamA family transporter RarD [Sphingomonas japonica]|uniref:Chloramphenicol-sensitive protein RarD n=1 Tax=Sphingomonas japonica TaxID=511662 RepID=A0ABX0U211_9SPHN|nr:EamA family transporter RarD [Sphingomonas japonica]NIJ22817.1 chloramphenicol-sensitive protein RarD [Sphingomonas japonica]